MGEITAASQEQSIGIAQVNGAVSKMDDITQQNTALVEEAAAAAESMLEQTDELMNAVSAFRLEDEGNSNKPLDNNLMRILIKSNASKASQPPVRLVIEKQTPIMIVKASAKSNPSNGNWKEF